MSAEKLTLPVTACGNGIGYDIFDALGRCVGGVVDHRIPADVALRAAEAAAAVINEALTPAWTWEPSAHPGHCKLFFRGNYHDTLVATDAMAQAMCDGLNAAGVEP